jgi:hypothetical protein
MPLASAWSISLCFIILEAWQMSVVPSMSAAIPTPEPGPLIDMLACGFCPMKSSAHTELNGVTVFDPMILMEVDGVPPQAARTRTKASTTIRGMSNFSIGLFNLLFSFYIGLSYGQSLSMFSHSHHLLSLSFSNHN